MADTGELTVPSLVRILRLARDWGWLLVGSFIAFGWNFNTPANKLDAMTLELRNLRDTLHLVRDAQHEQGILLEWQTHVTCRGLSPLERGVAYPCRKETQQSPP